MYKFLQKKSIQFSLFAMLFLIFSSCGLSPDFRSSREVRLRSNIILQPIDNSESIFFNEISHKITEFYGFNVVVGKNKSVPPSFVNHEKGYRYSADSMLKHLKTLKPDSGALILGITERDVFITKRINGEIKKPESKYRVWGIFGLAQRPGQTCIVSTYRLQHNNKQKYEERLTKVVLHEIGHNLGLKHCKDKKCFMTDAVESIGTIDNTTMNMCNECLSEIQ